MESGQHVPEAAAAERSPARCQAGTLARVISPPLLHDVHCGDRRARSVREQHSNTCSGRLHLPPSPQPAPAQPWCPSLPQCSLWVAHACWRQSGAWGSTCRRRGPKLPSAHDFITAVSTLQGPAAPYHHCSTPQTGRVRRGSTSFHSQAQAARTAQNYGLATSSWCRPARTRLSLCHVQLLRKETGLSLEGICSERASLL